VKGERWNVELLPGPRRHLESVALDLDDGLSCLWLVPDDLVRRNVADRLLGTLESRADSVRVPVPEVLARQGEHRPTEVIEHDGAVPAWAESSFGVLDRTGDWNVVTPAEVGSTASVAERLLPFAEETIRGSEVDDPLAVLAASQWIRNKVVVVCAWEENDPEDIAETLTRLTAYSREHGMPRIERPRLLVAARLGDVPCRLFDQIDPVTTRVHWWWGAYGRLDTAVVAATYQQRRTQATRADFVRDLVAAEVLVEVAGPDLSLAEYLASSWDGRMVTLKEQLVAFEHADTDVLLPRRHLARGRGKSPVVELRQAWTAGLVDLWDGEVRTSPALDGVPGTAEEIATLVWRGQNRALTPLIDGLRAQLEEQVRSRASNAVIAELTRERGNDIAEAGHERSTLELGTMAWAVATKRVHISKADRDRLFCLRDIRNALAHLRPLNDIDIEHIAAVLPDKSW
jgi:hypothetical protein